MDSATIASFLQNSISHNPADIKAAESQLTQAENQSAGTLLRELLVIVFADAQPIGVRQSASIFCKNLLKRRWTSSADESLQFTLLDDANKVQVRSLLLAATCGPAAVPQPRQIQSQVNAIISFIADADFPKLWPELLPSLVQTLNSSPSNELRLNALTCLCSVFRKYKTASRSTEMLLELQYLLPLFQATHLQLFSSVLPGILANPTSTPKEVFAAMDQILEIFYSLNVIDIPEFYQDSLSVWMAGFLQLLALPHAKSSSDEPGPVETLKALTCDNLALYADKYQEPFEPFVTESVKAVWSLLVGLDCNESRFDQLVASGIRFLSSTANTRWSQSPFAEEEALVQICEKLILPNIQLRDVDIELFVDNPDDYIRKDLQNADADTRRRSAVDLVKSLSKFYEDKITAILLQYVGNLLSSFASNKRAKDACIQLVTAIAAKGETRAHGVSLVNPKVDVNQFFQSQLLPELTTASTSDEQAVLKASCLKFIILFRNQLEKSLLNQALPGVLTLLSPTSAKVVQCYAAHCAVLLLSVPGVHAPDTATASATAERAIGIIMSTGEQNEHLIKLVWKLKPTSPSLMAKLMMLVTSFSANPLNAAFTHYLFEALGSVVAADTTKTRESLIQPLCQLLDKNVMEYIPYALQILALLIESGGPGQSEVFTHLFTLLLNEALWKNPSLVPGIVRIMSAYSFRADTYGQLVLGQMTTLVSRFQILLSSAKFEATAFDLLNAMTTSPHLPAMSPEVLQPILIALLTKIHTKRTERLIRQFAISLACLVASPQFQVDSLVGVLEKVQAGLSVQVIKDLWMTSVGNITAPTAKVRKVIIVSLAKLVTSPSVTSNSALLHAVLAATEAFICVNPGKEVGSTTGGIGHTHETGAEDGLEFEVSYARLSATANAVVEADFIPHVQGDGVNGLKQALRSIPSTAMQGAPHLAQWM